MIRYIQSVRGGSEALYSTHLEPMACSVFLACCLLLLFPSLEASPPVCQYSLTLTGPHDAPTGTFFRLDQPSVPLTWRINTTLSFLVNEQAYTPTTWNFFRSASDAYTITIVAYFDKLVLLEGDAIAYRLGISGTDPRGVMTQVSIPASPSGSFQCSFLPDIVYSYYTSFLFRNWKEVGIAFIIITVVLATCVGLCALLRHRDYIFNRKRINEIRENTTTALGITKTKSPPSAKGRRKALDGTSSREMSTSIERNDSFKQHVISASALQADGSSDEEKLEMDSADGEFSNHITPEDSVPKVNFSSLLRNGPSSPTPSSPVPTGIPPISPRHEV